MTTITNASLTLDAFEAPHGALLPYPLAVLDVDALPPTHRIDKSAPFFADSGWSAAPLQPFTGAWRSCTPGAPIVVSAVTTAPDGSVYVQSSADGVNVADSLQAGNLSGSSLVGLRFSTTMPFYRVVVPVSEPCRGSVLTQQRA